jgi:hypothetical protein
MSHVGDGDILELINIGGAEQGGFQLEGDILFKVSRC